MLEPPRDVSDGDVLETVRRHWPGAGVNAVEHLPVGWGAHHWRGSAGLRPVLFITWDTLGEHHTAQSLEATYAAAADLAFRLDTVVAGLPSEDLGWTVPLAGGALSVTPWVMGERAGDGPPTDRTDAERCLVMLRRLHGTPAPAGLPTWTPLAPRPLPDLDRDWHDGPLGKDARALLRAHVDDVRGWADRHARLAERALAAHDRGDVAWVVTHGEPHTRNQLRTPIRTLLVDWESARVAPRERDLLWLVHSGHADLLDPAPDPDLLQLFDLERRLDEIGQHAHRLAGPHDGGADDRTALVALREELERP